MLGHDGNNDISPSGEGSKDAMDALTINASLQYGGHPSGNNAPEAQVTHSSSHEASTALLEELGRVQKKLSKIDQRTQLGTKAIYNVNYLMALLADKESLQSYIFNRRQSNVISDGPSFLEKGREKESIATTSDGDGDVGENLQSYLDYEKRKLEVKHEQEMRIFDLTSNDLATYVYGEKHINSTKTQGGIDEGGESPPNTKPILNWVDWYAFKASGQALEESFVVDVLIGEPILPGHSAMIYNPRQRQKQPVSFDEQNDGVPRELTYRGQDPLPERIRIRSNSLVSILDRVLGFKVSYYMRRRNSDGVPTIVMVRPFKALSFHQNHLRDWYASMKSKSLSGTGHQGDLVEDDIPSTTLDAHKSDTPSNEATEKGLVEGQNTNIFDSEELAQADGKPQEEDHITLSPTAHSHLRCLLDFIDTIIVRKQEFLARHCKRVTFIDLWHLFKPGAEVIEPGDKHLQCYKVIKVTSPQHNVSTPLPFRLFRIKEKQQPTVSIHCVYLDFDGTHLGPVSRKFDIARYQGEKDIMALPIYPLSLAENNSAIRQTLIERGKKFLQAVHVGHMHYNGLSLDSRDEIDSQVMVDFSEALVVREDRKNRDWKPNVQLRAKLQRKSPRKRKDFDTSSDSDSDSDSEDDNDNLEHCAAECCAGDAIYRDNYVDEKQNEEFLSSLLSKADDKNPAPIAIIARVLQKNNITHVIDDDLIIMTYRVFGFVLRSRSWAKLDLKDLMDLEEYRNRRKAENPIEESTKGNAFDNLVFPKDGLDRKKIVRSLVGQHFQAKESAAGHEMQADIVRGKGKGLIILLHGAPGVGKTTTAECIAELFNKPLFQLTCGDLGTTAREVETVLETNFTLANKWGSILLLDEADVFLARRIPQDFQRNGLVAVFLRVLEYYSGVLFLTTNRIGDFDEAFSSRIHISLHYPVLDYDSTMDIFALNWRLIRANLKYKGRTLHIDELRITAFVADYWTKYPTARWNGSQVRNACHTALSLAEFEAQTNDDGVVINPDAEVRLGVSHIETVADAYLEFMKYLQDVRDADQEKYAFLMGIRRQEGRRGMPENPLAHDPSTAFRRGQLSRLAGHRVQSAARYSRPEQQEFYQQNEPYTHSQGGSPTRHRGAPNGGLTIPPYQPFSQQQQGGVSHQAPFQPQPQRGWNPGPVGGYYAGVQGSQHQQSSSPGPESPPASSQYGQHLQP